MIRGVLFDMDGVLLDSEKLGMERFPVICKDYGYEVAPELFLQLVGTTNAYSRQLLLGTLGADFPYDAVMGALDKYRMDMAKQGKMPLKKGVEACMEGLKARGISRALATSSERDVVNRYIESIPALQNVFDAMVCGAEGGRSKPAPDIYLTAAKRLGLTPKEVIGVEDSPNGVKSLTAAQIPSVLIPDLLPYGAGYAGFVKYRLQDLTGLCPLIDRLNLGARVR